ncbi:hypothetical protein P4H71_26170 [Paenibacillus kribbensis]|uniref:hypothetical protein n=1 Tax=Paenibacillus kribbensis TaxID=172713 RepID=UPI002DBE2A60|nr:hypothetical protein [Paenibacillus kribbensis]MEC0237808.1 hypothetical protein [Paenibacillus kribbensis]
MGTSIPNQKNETASQGQGDVKTYILSPEELAEIVGKPIPKSHTRPLSFRAKTKSIKEEKSVAKASKDDPKPAAQPDDSYKTVLTKAEDEAIKWLLEDWSREDLLRQHAATPNGWQRGTQAEDMNGMPVWKLANALIVGYEVKQTKEDILLDYHQKCWTYGGGAWKDGYSGEAFRAGMYTALKIIDMKVPGITD